MQAMTFVQSIPLFRTERTGIARSCFIKSRRMRTFTSGSALSDCYHFRRSPQCSMADMPESFRDQTEDEVNIDDPIVLSPDELGLCEEMPLDVPMINKLVLVGRLGRDPELKTVGEDLQVCQFRLAVPNDYDPDDDDDEDKTSWFTVEAWGRTARYIASTGRKGMRVGITGSLGVNAWTGRDGDEREEFIVTADSFEVLQSRSERVESMPSGPKSYARGKSMPASSYDIDKTTDATEDFEDLPF